VASAAAGLLTRGAPPRRLPDLAVSGSRLGGFSPYSGGTVPDSHRVPFPRAGIGIAGELIIGLVEAAAVDLDAVLGDTRPLWDAWVSDLARRLRLGALELLDDRVAAARELDGRVGNWPVLLERFAEEHAPVFLRPDAGVNDALRRLAAAGARLGAFTDAPEPLARVAAAHLGVARRLEALEAGEGALARLHARLGDGAVVVRSRGELLRLAG